MPRRLRPSTIPEWPAPFDASTELDWGRPDFNRRLLREHLDQSHDGASRRRTVVAAQVRRLARLLPPGSRLLDAGCGPGLYAVRLGALGYEVTGVDVGPASLRHARRAAAAAGVGGRARFRRGDLRDVAVPAAAYDAVLLIYFVLEAFPREEQVRVLRRLARALRPGGRLIAELRLRPEQPPGRTTWWDVVDDSVLADRRHLLLGDTSYDARRHTYVLREVAVFDDGTVSVQQTSGWLCPFASIQGHFGHAGLAVDRIYDGWTAHPGTALSESVLVVARPDEASRYHGQRRPRRAVRPHRSTQP